MKRHLLLFLLALAPSAFAQSSRGIFTYERTTAGSSEPVTLHIASGSSRTARLIAITVYCETACTATLARDGSAPTATAATANALNAGTASVVPYYSSNVGAGTSIKSYNVAATEEKVIDMTSKGLTAGKNITITPSLSGARVFFIWSEY